MVQVKFYGDLKRFVREPVELEVDSFSELMSGLLTQIKGLRDHLKKGFYKVRVGKNTYLDENHVKAGIAFKDDCTIHFTPVIAGAGKGVGIGQIIVGVVLIAASWYAGAAAGWSYLGAQGFAGATMAFTVGASLIVSGAISLLTPTPSMGDQKIKEGEKNQSTSFSNLKNLTPQGRPIPLLYGRMMTSLVLVSQGAEAYDDAPEADNTQADVTGKRRRLKRN